MSEIDELRVKIAKALGWRLEHQKDMGSLSAYPNGGWCIVDSDGAMRSGYWSSPDKAWEGIWCHRQNWPRSIADAWELVEDAQGKGVGLDLVNSEITRYETGIEPAKHHEWQAVFYDPIGGRACQQYKAEAPTAPEAISRAYLAWKESKS